MICKMKKNWMLLMLFCGVLTGYTQEEKQKIKEEDVVVEFSFNPTLSDVFKLKTTPKSQEVFKKEKITYQISEKKIKSDFHPIVKKARYVSIDPPKSKKYRNYIYGGFGLYQNGEFELSLRPELTDGYLFGADVDSYNYQNGVNTGVYNNARWQSNGSVFVGRKLKDISWKGTFTYDRDLVNWYGVAPNSFNLRPPANDTFQQIYQTFKGNGVLTSKNAFFKEVSSSLQYFKDEYGGSEAALAIETAINPKLFNNYIRTNATVSYLRGGFKKHNLIDNTINYSFLNAEITPSYTYTAAGFKVETALGLLLNSNTEMSKTQFLVLPKVVTTIPLVANVMVFKGGIKSDFIQNTYQQFAKENPFVAPALLIKPTFNPVTVFAGLQGKLSRAVAYSTEVSYQKIKDQALFLHSNIFNFEEVFAYGNSFGVVYDDMSVLGVKGTVNVKISEHLKTGVTAELKRYDLENQLKAWNLPNFVFTSYANYTEENWFANASLNMVNGRDDVFGARVLDLKSIFDINLKGGYALTKQLKVHANLYNLLNSHYESFLFYQVQGFQAVAGVSYKF